MNIAKRLLSASVVLCIIGVLCACNAQTNYISQTPIEGSFRTTIMDTGKSDAIILRTDNHVVIIDTGEKNDGKALVSKLDEYGIDTVDYLFITHFDQDHVGGAPKLMKNITINSIVTPDYKGNNSEYEKFIEACGKYTYEPIRLSENMTLSLDDVTFEVYPPMQSTYEEEDNDYSLVISVTHGDNTLLFAGDAETERLSELPQQLSDMRHIFVKMPHHGRYCEGTDEFIKAVDPTYAVITCSEDEGADSEVLALLKGVKTFLTVNGEAEVVSDGTRMSVTQTAPVETSE